MDAYDVIRISFLGIFAVLLSVNLAQVHHTDAVGDQQGRAVRYAPFAVHLVLPAAMAAWVVTEALFGTLTSDYLGALLGLNFQIFLSASVYFVVLLMLLPWLRRTISARTCGFLWLMPTFLYVAYYNFTRLQAPWVILRLPEGWLMPLLAVWGLGTAAVLALSVVRHLGYRRDVLGAARPVEDPDILEVWTSEQRRAGRKRDCPLLVSSALTTPLSIGLFRRSIRVVLPEREYQRRDLQLILRHEVVHLCRLDNWNKLFLTVCTALFWFNPLMWMARNRCSEDLELSCDETVLLDADRDIRTRYAQLLLTTAGEARGFTTCLSASAQSLRYRLKAVVSPVKRSLGGAALGAAFLVLALPFGGVTVSLQHGTLGELALTGTPELEQLRVYQYPAELPDNRVEIQDPAAVWQWLQGLEVDRVAGLYETDREDEQLQVGFTMDGQAYWLNLGEGAVVLRRDRGEERVFFLGPAAPRGTGTSSPPVSHR